MLALGAGETPEPAAGATPPTREAFRVSVAAVTHPGATRGFLVQPNSIFNGEWRITILPEPAAAESIQRALPVGGDPDGLPIAQWRESAGDIEWRTSVVPAPSPHAGDSSIVASIEVRARNTGSTTIPVRLAFRLEHAAPERAFTAFESAATALGAPDDDLINGWCGAATSGADATFHEVLRPGATATFRILMPSAPAPRRVLQSMANTSHADYTRQCRNRWRSIWESGTSIKLGDGDVELACRQALTLLLGSWERRDSAIVPIGGPFHYRDIWVRDGARAAVAVGLWGHSELARGLDKGLLSFQWPQGFIMSQRGQPDGTGQALWAVEQTHLRGERQTVPPANG